MLVDSLCSLGFQILPGLHRPYPPRTTFGFGVIGRDSLPPPGESQETRSEGGVPVIRIIIVIGDPK